MSTSEEYPLSYLYGEAESRLQKVRKLDNDMEDVNSGQVRATVDRLSLPTALLRRIDLQDIEELVRYCTQYGSVISFDDALLYAAEHKRWDSVSAIVSILSKDRDLQNKLRAPYLSEVAKILLEENRVSEEFAMLEGLPHNRIVELLTYCLANPAVCSFLRVSSVHWSEISQMEEADRLDILESVVQYGSDADLGKALSIERLSVHESRFIWRTILNQQYRQQSALLPLFIDFLETQGRMVYLDIADLHLIFSKAVIHQDKKLLVKLISFSRIPQDLINRELRSVRLPSDKKSDLIKWISMYYFKRFGTYPNTSVPSPTRTNSAADMIRTKSM